ncbi:sigma-70 family RNA polymerase sigma factor [Kribbella sp. NPDC051770]|uniref:sigma-70 family RNA polymerase sigma factor n=1 Tax=Kribbella sp. NPDC051770 TaxID=3155413 RepID=UPI0034440151
MLTLSTFDGTDVPTHCSTADDRARRDQATRELLTTRAATTDEAERRRLLEQAVELNLELARGIAQRYRGRGAEDEDLEQVAFLGLMKAAAGYRTDTDVPFIGYAVPTIRGEVKRYFRDCTWTVRIPRGLQDLQGKIARVLPILTQELGREPDLDEIAVRLNVSPADIRQAESARGCFNVISLDRPAGETDLPLGDSIADAEDPYLHHFETVDMLGPILDDLAPRDRRILELRFIENRKQADIGTELGISQMQVSRLLSRILADLRVRLAPTTAAAA